MQTSSVPALVMRRVYAAAPERVYAAWTDPQLAQQFLSPGEVQTCDVAMDVRAGGAYRIGMKRPDGDVWYVRGTYREVIPNARLVMTWQWEEDDPSEEHESLLTIDLAPHGSGTELTLRHERLANLESREGHEHGWTSILDNLERLQ